LPDESEGKSAWGKEKGGPKRRERRANLYKGGFRRKKKGVPRAKGEGKWRLSLPKAVWCPKEEKNIRERGTTITGQKERTRQRMLLIAGKGSYERTRGGTLSPKRFTLTAGKKREVFIRTRRKTPR